MKRTITVLLFLAFIIASCNKDTSNRNPYLTEQSFKFEINLNLPLYGSLSTPGNAVYVGNNNVGLKGIIVFNSGFGTFFAWEASCPNHAPNSCSTMTIEGGVTAVCSCEDYTYSLSNGVPLTDTDEKLHSLLNYRVDVNGNILIVSN